MRVCCPGSDLIVVTIMGNNEKELLFIRIHVAEGWGVPLFHFGSLSSGNGVLFLSWPNQN